MSKMTSQELKRLYQERADVERQRLSEAVAAAITARQKFHELPSNETHDAKIAAEEEVLYAKARLQEWL